MRTANGRSGDETSKHPKAMDKIAVEALYDERADISRARPWRVPDTESTRI